MSNKEIELIKFLNEKTDVLNNTNNNLKVIVVNNENLTQENFLAYVNGYNSAIKDFKYILLKLLKGDYVVYDEKESSETH